MNLLFHRLFTLPIHYGRSFLSAKTRRIRRVKRLLALLGMASCLCLGLSALTDPVRAQTPAASVQPLVLPHLSTEPPIYHPGNGETSQTAESGNSGRYQAVAFEQPTPVAQATEPATSAPEAPPEAPNVEPRSATAEPRSRKQTGPLNRYVMEFNRNPAVGNRLRLQGVYPESRLNFTRPKTWNVQTAKILLRYQHSPALLADKSRLVVRVNDTSVGSLPLNRSNSELAEASFTVPTRLIQDNNEIAILAEQQTTEACSNPADPMLWTEVLPNSQVIFDYRPQPMRLDFSSYPLPFVDPLNLEPNQLSYLKPKTYSDNWLTLAARFQTATARLVDRQPLSTQLVSDPKTLKRDDRLIVIGTPAEQPILSTVSLPFALQNGKFVDGERKPVSDSVGLLMLTTLKDNGTPVLVATGNSEAGVRKAVQMLVQARDQKLASGQAVVVDQLAEVPSPDVRNWPGYLPTDDKFSLAALTMFDEQAFQDVTVRGTNAPSIAIPFRALPEDRFLRGSAMTLHYSNSPQVNPRTSAVEVKLDGVTIASKRLLDANSEDQTFRVNLPEGAIRPDSTLNVNFIMHSKELGVCGLETDQQLWGTLYGDTSLNLIRDRVVNLPDLKLFQTGYPFTAPQDLAATAIVLPAQPTATEVQTLLALAERLGRLSQAESVQYQVYTGETPVEVRNRDHVIGIGTRERFPVAEVFQAPGFNLAEAFTRFWTGTRVQALPDQEGVMKASLSPWNRERSLLGLTAQTEAGLTEMQTLLRQDSLFAKIAGDTVLVSRNRPDPSPYDASGYNVQTLQETPPKRIQANYSFNQIVMFLQDYWFLLLAGMLLLALLLYALSQSFLNRVAHSEEV